MEVKKIVEGMTAPEVAQVIDENFNALNGEKATVEAVADVQKNVNRSDDNTGILSYPVFDDTEPVAVGDVRRYEGLLYRAKEAGAHDWDPEKWERVTLKQLEDEKLSELGSKLENSSFDGDDNNFVSVKFSWLKKSNKYRIEFRKTEWDTEGLTQSGYKLYISVLLKDGTQTMLFGSYTSSNIPKHFDFTTPEDFDYLVVSGRAKKGDSVSFSIIDIERGLAITQEFSTKLANLQNQMIDGDDNSIKAIINGRNGNYVFGKCLNTEGNIITYVGWNYIEDYIEVSEDDIILWRIGDVSFSGAALVIYDENKEYLTYFGANTTPDRTVVMPKGAKYIRVSFCGMYKGKYNSSPININGNPYYAVYPIENLEDKITFIANEVIKINSQGNYAKDKVLLYTGEEIQYSGWNYTTQFVSVNEGDIILWRVGDVKFSGAALVVYDGNKEFLSYFGANITPERTVTIPSGGKYIRVSFFSRYKEESNTIPFDINGISYNLIEPSISNIPSDTAHGMIGEYYPEQTKEIEGCLNYENYGFVKRFHFLHTSDNHGGNFGYADELLDLSPALFLINTGDMLLDKFSDFPNSQTVALATATEKPCYLVLGNHDYSHAPSKQDVFDAFMQPTHQHNGITTDKTYYSVDYTDYGVKCIMLDMNDGWDDTELQQLGPTPLTRGNMSNEQILWFITQLEDAAANGLHVCLFIHIVPCQIDSDRVIDNFSDYNALGSVIASNLTFLADIVDSWIDGTSISFEYKGMDYNHTFSAKGHFVSWFFGHLHWDECGWMKDHPNQFMVGVCKPVDGYTGFGSYDGDKLGVHFNYYTIDTFMNSLAVYRVGQQDTVYATERKSFRIRYK